MPSRGKGQQLLCRSAGSYFILYIDVRSVKPHAGPSGLTEIAGAAILTKPLILLILYSSSLASREATTAGTLETGQMEHGPTLG